MKILIATGNAKLNGALYASLDNASAVIASDGENVINSCLSNTPDLAIIGNKLSLSDGSSWRNVLPFLKQKCPHTRFIFIHNQLKRTNLDDKYFVQTLIAYGIYDIYTNEKVLLKKLLRMINSPRDRYDNEKWLKAHKELRIEVKRQKKQKQPIYEEEMIVKPTHDEEAIGKPIYDDVMITKSIRPRLKETPKPSPLGAALSNNAGYFKINKQLIGALLILTGGVLIYTGYSPIKDMKEGLKETESQWAEIKQEEDSDSSQEFIGMTSVPEGNELIGMIQISSSAKKIGIRYGANKENLDYGAALDKNSSFLTTSKGNSVIYGHREEFFWDLKDIKNGDIISVELASGTLNYEVYTTFVTSPDDTSYYSDYNDAEITLVTCHPFVYMGPTTNRFIVKARLIK